LIESVPKKDPIPGEVIPKRETLSTDMMSLSTEKEPLMKGFSGIEKGVINSKSGP